MTYNATWDVHLYQEGPGTGSGTAAFEATAAFAATGSGTANVVKYTATWDAALYTQTWKSFSVSGTAILSTEGYMLAPSDDEGYTMRESTNLGYELEATTDASGYALATESEKTGYTLLA